MFTSADIGQFETVQVWATGLKEQWGGDPLVEDPGKLDALCGFCEFMGKTPDELYHHCFLRKRDTGERFASKKRRDELIDNIRRFVEESGRMGTEKRRLRSSVNSFFSHNGILI